jgi:hypothetical protein
MTTTTTQAPTGLRAAKREQAQARQAAKDRHPAGKQAPAKAPAKKAAPKAAKPAGLRWQFPNGKDEYPDGKTQGAPFGDGELAILRAGDGWKAIYRVNGKIAETLATGSFGKCYTACTRHAKGAAA